MKFFTKKELLSVLLIFSGIILISLNNFRISLRRARDVQRKNDLRIVADGLVKYASDFASFPVSQEGKIVACRGPETKIDKKGNISGLVFCEWGKDSLRDIFDPDYPAYIEVLPKDPLSEKGYQYLYFSDGERFQIYASLEGTDEAEYDSKIVARNLKCGVGICNFGLSYGSVPLDKSLEEYKNELMDRN